MYVYALKYIIIYSTKIQNIHNEKHRYDSTEKEKHPADQSTLFHRVRPATQKSYTGRGIL